MRGSRVQAVVQELQGEKIDIIPWSPDSRHLRGERAGAGRGDEGRARRGGRRVEVVVPDDQLSLAIGRRGQNVRLASQLTRWDIDILTEAEESERRQEEFRKRTGLFVEALDVDDVIAGLLVTEGFTSIEDVIAVDDEELAASRASTRASPAELKRRAESLPRAARRRAGREAPRARRR